LHSIEHLHHAGFNAVPRVEQPTEGRLAPHCGAIALSYFKNVKIVLAITSDFSRIE
jgi:hypothetical protein